MRQFDLINVFGTVIDKVTLSELRDTRVIDSDTLDTLVRLDKGQTIDLYGFEGAMMVRRVS